MSHNGTPIHHNVFAFSKFSIANMFETCSAQAKCVDRILKNTNESNYFRPRVTWATNRPLALDCNRIACMYVCYCASKWFAIIHFFLLAHFILITFAISFVRQIQAHTTTCMQVNIGKSGRVDGQVRVSVRKYYVICHENDKSWWNIPTNFSFSYWKNVMIL